MAVAELILTVVVVDILAVVVASSAVVAAVDLQVLNRNWATGGLIERHYFLPPSRRTRST